MNGPSIIDLGALTWTSGFDTKKVLELDGIPDGIGDKLYKVARLYLDIEFDITTEAAESVNYTDMQQHITLQHKIAGVNFLNSITVEDLWFILMQRRFRSYPPIPSTVDASTANAERHILLEIPFARAEKPFPLDWAPLADLLNGTDIKVKPGGSAIGTGGALNSLTVRAYAELVQSVNPRMVALPVYERYTTKKHDTLPDGVYTELLLMPPAAGFTDEGEVTDLAVRAGDQDLWDHVTPEAVLCRYVFSRAWDTSNLGSSIESWSEDADAFNFLPVIFPVDNAEMSKIVHDVDTQGKPLAFEVTGDLTELDWLMCRFEALDGGAVRRQAQDLGISNSGSIVGSVATANGESSKAAEALGNTGIRVLPTTISGMASAASKLPSRIAGALRLKRAASGISQRKQSGKSTSKGLTNLLG